MTHQKEAVESGYWPLYRYHPARPRAGRRSGSTRRRPSISLHEFEETETRFAVLDRPHPERAAQLAELAQADVDERWHYYEQLAEVERTMPPSTSRPRHRARGPERRRLPVRR